MLCEQGFKIPSQNRGAEVDFGRACSKTFSQYGVDPRHFENKSSSADYIKYAVQLKSGLH